MSEYHTYQRRNRSSWLHTSPVPCSHSLRPVRAKVKANHSPILLPLQGVGIYTLIPRALPWALNWQPFQGAPFRALFVYHVRTLRRLLFGKKRTEIFLDFEHPTQHGLKIQQSHVRYVFVALTLRAK